MLDQHSNWHNAWLRANSEKPSYSVSMELLSEVQSVLVQVSLPEITLVRSGILTAILAAKDQIRKIHRLDTSTVQKQETLT